jgi:hypothetical protein
MDLLASYCPDTPLVRGLIAFTYSFSAENFHLA